MRYEKATEGIRVWVRPRFSLAESDPTEGTFVFSYQVGLANEGLEPARLLFRHWRIHDSAAGDSLVDGEGVIGQQPLLAPGDSHEYSSFCVLRSPVGFMEGYYTFARPDGSRFRVDVPRFNLSGPLVVPMTGRDVVDREDNPGLMN
jgi:ApaG protein